MKQTRFFFALIQLISLLESGDVWQYTFVEVSIDVSKANNKFFQSYMIDFSVLTMLTSGHFVWDTIQQTDLSKSEEKRGTFKKISALTNKKPNHFCGEVILVIKV